jgi:hypothetical protein
MADPTSSLYTDSSTPYANATHAIDVKYMPEVLSTVDSTTPTPSLKPNTAGVNVAGLVVGLIFAVAIIAGAAYAYVNRRSITEWFVWNFDLSSDDEIAFKIPS